MTVAYGWPWRFIPDRAGFTSSGSKRGPVLPQAEVASLVREDLSQAGVVGEPAPLISAHHGE
jgi:hypothetical protein